ncbi:MAG: bacteriohemerythrin, partial [Magnetococcales bacterium]|nr:bacteriohemerythrin [Magnetococcales bacterium]
VEKIRTRDDFLSRIHSGALVGEMAGLMGTPSTHTYATVGYVKALEIPVGMYRELVQRNGFMERILRHSDLSGFLQSTRLFSEGMSTPIIAQLLDDMEMRTIHAGQYLLCRDLNRLNLIRRGRVERSLAGKRIDMLEVGDHFGEERSVFQTPCLFRLKAEEDLEVYQFSGHLLRDIPIVRWKLFEAYHTRSMMVVHGDGANDQFHWDSAFNIQILEMDTHHKRLVEIANAIIEILRHGEDWGSLENAFESLVDYTEYHFQAEEYLMERYGYPELARHQARHRQLVEQVIAYRDQLQQHSHWQQLDFRGFFTQWLVRHILQEDRQYGEFLNARCVF